MNIQVYDKQDRKGEDIITWGMGLTAITAMEFLQRELPDVKNWMCWKVPYSHEKLVLRAIVGRDNSQCGQIGKWSWKRVPTSYPDAEIWDKDTGTIDRDDSWTGLIEVKGDDGEKFYIFSYLTFSMNVNTEYFVSTRDRDMLKRFTGDLAAYYYPKDDNYINVRVVNGEDFKIRRNEKEKLYITEEVESDIYTQIDAYFGSGTLYEKLGIPHKRGFLFTGVPGTGKTMMIRNIIRHCHKKYDVGSKYLHINSNLTESEMWVFFNALHDEKPSLLILEDVESMIAETRISRSQFLNCLDGVDRSARYILIATANRPEELDSALLHRPSRFDRVWKFPLPSQELRVQYMAKNFPDVAESLRMDIARESRGWTFAYLKEVKITAATLAANEGLDAIKDEHLAKAFRLLKAQFKAGQKNHTLTAEGKSSVGFDIYTDEEEIKDRRIA